MRRTPLIGAALAVLSVVVPVGLAGAGPELPSASSPPVGRALVVRSVRLGCEVRTTDADAVVRCRWSATDSAAAGVRLWRSDPTVDRRTVVFRSDDASTTSYTDTAVRPNHRYTYVVQLVTASGRVLAQSRPSTVFVPPSDQPEVEVLRLDCTLGPRAVAVGCEWSPPAAPAAEVVELWRSVDGGTRRLVERFRPEGETTYRDLVPDGASRIAYAVLATTADGRIVGRSRPELVRIPGAPSVSVRPVDRRPDDVTVVTPRTGATTDTRPVDARPTDTRPTDTRPTDTRPTDTTVRPREGTAP